MMNERVSELTTYLKALSDAQGSGYKCNGEIAEVIRELRFQTGLINAEDKAGVYHRKLIDICGDYYKKDMRFINNQIYHAYLAGVSGELYFSRCSGVTTSIKALMEVFDDVVYIETGKASEVNVTDKVVFRERNEEIPRGARPKCVIKIHPFEITGGGSNYYDAVIY